MWTNEVCTIFKYLQNTFSGTDLCLDNQNHLFSSRQRLAVKPCNKDPNSQVHWSCFKRDSFALDLEQFQGLSWSWSNGSWIYNYLRNQCLSPLTLWIWTLLRRGVLNTTLCDKVCQWLATGRWFSLGTPVSYTNKTDPQAP